MTRPLEFSEGEFYHVYNRGTEKRKVFLNRNDYARFTALLYICNSNEPVHIQDTPPQTIFSTPRSETYTEIGAYCLMPNHFHLLLYEKTAEGISKFMQKLLTAYTMYFNKKYNRSGALFQGKFKARHVDKDEYLKYLISYIHLNPIKLIDPDWKERGISDKSKAEQFLNTYEHSSYLDFLGDERAKEVIINREILPDYFETKQNFKSCVTEWLNYNNT